MKNLRMAAIFGEWKSGGKVTKRIFAALAILAMLLMGATALLARAPEEAAGGEANLKLPDLSQVSFLGINGHTLLLYGIVICVFGLIFGMTILHAAEEYGSAQLDERDFRADL